MLAFSSSKLLQVAATMVCLTEASCIADDSQYIDEDGNCQIYVDYGNQYFDDIPDFATVIEVKEETKKKNNCFQVSQIKGKDNGDFVSDLS